MIKYEKGQKFFSALKSQLLSHSIPSIFKNIIRLTEFEIKFKGNYFQLKLIKKLIRDKFYQITQLRQPKQNH